MRITGTLHSIGHHRVLMPGTNTSGMNEADMLKNFDGVLVNTEAKAIGMIGTTVDIYPHPVNGLVAGECTPEHYAHALARLAHAEEVSPTADHLAREVRSSQALAAALETAQARISELTQMLAIAEGSAAKYEQKYLDASRALGEARAVLASVNLANARLMADDEAIAGDSELSDNEDEGRR